MLNKRKFLIKLCAALPAALLLTTTPVLADENDQTNQPQTSETNKQNVTYQSLYWRCINQYTGQTLQVMYADTVKVVNGVPERQFFNMGQLPERIGDFEIAGNPSYGGRALEVDPNNPSGVTYINCAYYLPNKKDSSSATTPHNQQHSQNVTKDNHNSHSAIKKTDKWRHQHKMPNSATSNLNKKQNASPSKAATSSKPNKKKATSKKNKPATAKNHANVQAERNSNILKFVVTPLVIIVIAAIYIPRKFWHRNRGKHAE